MVSVAVREERSNTELNPAVNEEDFSFFCIVLI